MWKLSCLPNPPLRLIVGEDALDECKAKLTQVTAELAEYETWSREV